MKKKLKKLFDSKIFLCIMTTLVVGTVSVSATTYFASNDVTYDNSVSGLESTDVQGAIDELYNACKTPVTGGDFILEEVPVVTSGDGLYKDEYEEGKYFYRGGNPNNYITFNNEQAGWRIMSIENTGIMKIMRVNSIREFAYDTTANNDWLRPSTLNTYLNGDYYNGLSSDAQNQIVSHNFAIGPSNFSDDLAVEISEENSRIFAGKIAIPIISEYIRTSSNISECGSMNLFSNNFSVCKNTTWMYDSEKWWWTMSTYANGNTFGAYVALPNGFFPYGSNEVGRIYPVLYLSSNVKIISGDGSQNNPFQLSL